MIIEYLDEKFKKSGFMIQDWSLPINEEEWAHQLFYDKGFYSDSWGTIVVNTTKAEEELWKNLKKSRRNIVRRGINLGLKVKEARTKKDYDMVISIIKETSKRNNIFFHPQRYYRTLFDILSKKEMSKTFFIEEKGKGVATITMYLFGRRAIQTMVAHSDYSLQNQIPGTDFLEWHNIKWCHDNGYLTYDLAGIRPDSSDKKDISLKEYKQRWGGDIIRYPYFSKEYSKSKKGFVNKLMKVKRFLVKLSSG